MLLLSASVTCHLEDIPEVTLWLFLRCQFRLDAICARFGLYDIRADFELEQGWCRITTVVVCYERSHRARIPVNDNHMGFLLNQLQELDQSDDDGSSDTASEDSLLSDIIDEGHSSNEPGEGSSINTADSNSIDLSLDTLQSPNTGSPQYLP